MTRLVRWTVSFGDEHARTSADVVDILAESGTSLDEVVAAAARIANKAVGRASTISRAQRPAHTLER